MAQWLRAQVLQRITIQFPASTLGDPQQLQKIQCPPLTFVGVCVQECACSCSLSLSNYNCQNCQVFTSPDSFAAKDKLTTHLSHCSIALKRHHNQGRSYERKHLTGTCLLLERFSPCSSWCGTWWQAGRC